MAENSAISWTDHTFNPWIGCTRLSPACDGCYAAADFGEGGRRARVIWGGPGTGTGTRDRTSEGNWKQPPIWDKAARRRWETEGRPTFVFCASLADVFDNAVDPDWRRDLFNLIRLTPHLTWLLLTKRPQLIRRLFVDSFHTGDDAGERLDASLWWPRNAAIGTTIEDVERMPNLGHLMRAARDLRPAFAFVSCEPLLANLAPALRTAFRLLGDRPAWIITGGESDQRGHAARPTPTPWFRNVRDLCAEFGVAYHHKQNGEWGVVRDEATGAIRSEGDGRSTGVIWQDGRTPEFFRAGRRHGDLFRIGKGRAGRLLDGVLHDARPYVAPPPGVSVPA